MARTIRMVPVLLLVCLAGPGCKEAPDHHVICTQAKLRRANAEKGTPNDRQQRCHGMVQKHIQDAPAADHAAYADCILEAETEEAAAKCR